MSKPLIVTPEMDRAMRKLNGLPSATPGLSNALQDDDFGLITTPTPYPAVKQLPEVTWNATALDIRITRQQILWAEMGLLDGIIMGCVVLIVMLLRAHKGRGSRQRGVAEKLDSGHPGASVSRKRR